MFGWWVALQKRKRLAEEDAAILIARFGVRASHMANRRVMMMNDGAVFDANRPACHWKRVYSITRRLLPYDGDDKALLPLDRPGARRVPWSAID
jgi:hypothetical protein